MVKMEWCLLNLLLANIQQLNRSLTNYVNRGLDN